MLIITTTFHRYIGTTKYLAFLRAVAIILQLIFRKMCNIRPPLVTAIFILRNIEYLEHVSYREASRLHPLERLLHDKKWSCKEGMTVMSTQRATSSAAGIFCRAIFSYLDNSLFSWPSRAAVWAGTGGGEAIAAPSRHNVS